MYVATPMGVQFAHPNLLPYVGGHTNGCPVRKKTFSSMYVAIPTGVQIASKNHLQYVGGHTTDVPDVPERPQSVPEHPQSDPERPSESLENLRASPV